MKKLFNREKKEIFSNIKSSDIIINKEQMNQLPYCVIKWLKLSGIEGHKEISSLWIKQSIKMKLNQNQKKWNYAKAQQYITTNPSAFIWKVKMNFLKYLNIWGRDKFIDSKGEMLIRFGFIRLGKSKGIKIDEGTMQRFLAEMVWYPTYALSENIKWIEIDDYSAKAILTINNRSCEGTFHFNKNGFVDNFSTLRYMGNKTDKKIPWIAKINSYNKYEDFIIPSKMEAKWVLDSGEWTWLKLTVDEIKFNCN